MISKKLPIRVITATAIFDGHDASINIIRRMLQDRGLEVIHLGHNRSVEEVINAALQEDVDAICMSSYQGGHIEYFDYLIRELNKAGAGNILVFAGGGGTISEADARQLMNIGVKRVYTSKNSAKAGLSGIADEVVELCIEQKNKKYNESIDDDKLGLSEQYTLAKQISACQNLDKKSYNKKKINAKTIGFTGTGGAGKSTLIDEVLHAILNNSQLKIACISIDPSRQKTGGALLGDRIRMNCSTHPRLYFRSMATRMSNTSIPPVLNNVLHILDEYGFDLIVIETSGIGQSENQICEYVDHAVYVMSADYGAPGQLEKISMLDYADSVVLNKYDHQGSKDALKAVRKQWKNNHKQSDVVVSDIPIFPVRANSFNDPGIKRYTAYLFKHMLAEKSINFPDYVENKEAVVDIERFIPISRQNYLSEISAQARQLTNYNHQQCEYAQQIQHIYETLALLEEKTSPQVFKYFSDELNDEKLDELKRKDKTLFYLKQILDKVSAKLDDHSSALLEGWEDKKKSLLADFSVYKLRNETKQHNNFETSLSHNKIPVIAAASYSSWKDQLNFLLNENIPGEFPFTSGVYPYRNRQEDPTRMFAGEGTPEDTNRRFFLIKKSQKSIRLSTAFDPLVLYARDPRNRPDIYGCIGMSGVSISTLDDMKKLYSGINLCDENTSVSMTINGPASIIMAFYLNTAIDQQIEIYLKQQGAWTEVEKKIETLRKNKSQTKYNGKFPEGHNKLGLGLLGVNAEQIIDSELYQKISSSCCEKIRGTLQADILKEEQAQNECLYSLEFSFKLMSDLQRYFIQHKIKHFYGVSISGYHIAEAGANPVTQLAFTLANGFTLLEYYLAQGMEIDEFCPQFSFFFSNGMDAEYAVIGRIARRIWSRAIKYVYKGNERSQKLKYHIQTSGRSLQAQGIQLNDIRTSLQALYAIFDNCNSLHTNAYDEAVTTPTDESVRRALAIQLIINREMGLNLNQNPLQGSFLINELTNMVEQAVYEEFDRLTERGGVIGAMEYFYQRNKIQEESLYAESLKASGKQAVIGVNQFVEKKNTEQDVTFKFIHSTDKQKQQQIDSCEGFKMQHEAESVAQLNLLSASIQQGENSFQAILKASRYCTLEQISDVLLAVGGEYRRIV